MQTRSCAYQAKGFRVRIDVAHKDHYGPYRPTQANAEDELAKVRAQDDNTAAMKEVVEPRKAQQAQNPYVDGLLREVVQLPDRFGYPQGSVSKHDIPDLYLPPELHMALRAS